MGGGGGDFFFKKKFQDRILPEKCQNGVNSIVRIQTKRQDRLASEKKYPGPKTFSSSAPTHNKNQMVAPKDEMTQKRNFLTEIHIENLQMQFTESFFFK